MNLHQIVYFLFDRVCELDQAFEKFACSLLRWDSGVME